MEIRISFSLPKFVFEVEMIFVLGWHCFRSFCCFFVSGRVVDVVAFESRLKLYQGS